MLVLAPKRVALGPVGAASGLRAVEYHPAQKRVDCFRRFHVDHVPDARDRDFPRVANPVGQHVGHLAEAGHVQLADDNGRRHGDRRQQLDAVRVRRVRVRTRPVHAGVVADHLGEPARDVRGALRWGEEVGAQPRRLRRVQTAAAESFATRQPEAAVAKRPRGPEDRPRLCPTKRAWCGARTRRDTRARCLVGVLCLGAGGRLSVTGELGAAASSPDRAGVLIARARTRHALHPRLPPIGSTRHPRARGPIRR